MSTRTQEINSGASQRLHWVDFLRGVAVILMFITHSIRLEPTYHISEISGINTYLINAYVFFIKVEPFTFALFLFISIFTLVYFYEKKKPDPRLFIRHSLKRWLELWGWSAFLFFITYGFQWPDLFFASGALLAIGTTLMLISFLITLSSRWIFLTLIPVILLTVNYWMDSSEISIAGLNAGKTSLVCEMIFGFYGAIFALLYSRQKTKSFFLLILAALGLYGIGYLLDTGWVSIHQIALKFYHSDHSLIPNLKGFFSGASTEEGELATWNYLSGGMLMMLLPLMLSSWMASQLNTRFFERKWVAPVMILGQHSLFVYVAHLVLIELIQQGIAKSPLNPQTVFLFIFFLIGFNSLLVKVIFEKAKSQ